MEKGTVGAIVATMVLFWAITLYAGEMPSPDACFVVETTEATIIRARDRGMPEDKALAVMQKEQTEEAKSCRKYGVDCTKPEEAELSMETVHYIYEQRPPLTISKMLEQFEGAGCPKVSLSAFE
jgi:hypothetical protein